MTARRDPDAIVSTQPFAVRSAVSTIATIEIVRTRDTTFTLAIIDDRQLLALAPRSSALVRVGPHEQRLVLADGEAVESSP